MKVFKFGGASLRHPGAIRNAASIIEKSGPGSILVVASAIGKTTNALERIAELLSKKESAEKEISILEGYHTALVDELFGPGDPVYDLVSEQFKGIRNTKAGEQEFDRLYDEVVSRGELVSTIMLAEFLKKKLRVQWLDAREFIVTDSHFREGRVDWTATKERIGTLRSQLIDNILVTQGFIGKDAQGRTTTLGREGSDYTAAIFGSSLDAESVTIWKDVPGVMNADPKRFDGTTVFEELPFKEAAEMTYYGASVIHPKTIKPLANRNIPLLVKSFDDPTLPGTRIHSCTIANLPPLIVLKENQCLISCKVTDFSFIDEGQVSVIFQALAQLGIRINMMQNSAISFSFCVDYREATIQKLTGRLGASFEVYYNTGLTLITIKNYDKRLFELFRSRPGIVLEQSSRSTLQLLVRAGDGPDSFRITPDLLLA
jgi:aspartate kinase